MTFRPAAVGHYLALSRAFPAAGQTSGADCARVHRHFQGCYEHWAEIFNNGATLTSVLLDRLLRRAKTLLIDGQSYRPKGRVES
jgi:hypothetical protein